jgi:hypothetical protein
MVGMNAGPCLKGPIKAAPISPTPCAKKERSFSRVNTPGDTILSDICFSPKFYYVYPKFTLFGVGFFI